MLACGREHRSAVRQHREGVFGRVRLLDGGIGLGVAGGRVTVAVWLHVHVSGCHMVACTCCAWGLPYGCMYMLGFAGGHRAVAVWLHDNLGCCHGGIPGSTVERERLGGGMPCVACETRGGRRGKGPGGGEMHTSGRASSRCRSVCRIAAHYRERPSCQHVRARSPSPGARRIAAS